MKAVMLKSNTVSSWDKLAGGLDQSAGGLDQSDGGLDQSDCSSFVNNHLEPLKDFVI